MQSTDLEEIKAAIFEQASHPCTKVRWGVAQVMAVRQSRGQLLVLLRGFSRWHAVESVTIERPPICPTGACDLEEGETLHLSSSHEWCNEIEQMCQKYHNPATSDT